MPIRHNDIKAKRAIIPASMIHFVTALDCEARPLIHRYGLKPCGSHGRARFFANDMARLVVSGVGELRSAIATTALACRFPNSGKIWLNVGIAGHRDAAIGSGFIANRVSSDNSKDVYFPQIVARAPWPGIETRTLRAPSTCYQPNCLFDMEAYGFYSAALAVSTLEFIHVFKAVSDNATNAAIKTLDKEAVSESIATHLEQIEFFAQKTLENQVIEEISDWVKVARLEVQSTHRLSETDKHWLNEKLGQLSHLLDESDRKDFSNRLIGRDKRGVFDLIEKEIDKLSSQHLCPGNRCLR